MLSPHRCLISLVLEQLRATFGSLGLRRGICGLRASALTQSTDRSLGLLVEGRHLSFFASAPERRGSRVEDSRAGIPISWQSPATLPLQ